MGACKRLPVGAWDGLTRRVAEAPVERRVPNGAEVLEYVRANHCPSLFPDIGS